MRSYLSLKLTAAFAFAALCSSCVSINLGFGGRQPMKEEIVATGKASNASNKIAIVEMSGDISGETRSGLFGSDSSVVKFKDQLDKAAADKKVKAVVLRMNTPGGDVTASDIMYHQLLQFRESTKKPVLVSMSDLGASGGFYLAQAADAVYAHPTTVTGSIGVIMMLPNLKGLGDKLGVDMRIVKSAENKDLGSIWRDIKPEEQKLLQTMIDEMYNRFVTVVAAGRPNLTEAEIRKLADGRVYTGGQAVELGLIDGIAYLEEVIEMAKTRAGIKDAQVVRYKYGSGNYMGNIYASSPIGGASSLINIDAGGIMEDLTRPRFMYKWAPGL